MLDRIIAYFSAPRIWHHAFYMKWALKAWYNAQLQPSSPDDRHLDAAMSLYRRRYNRTPYRKYYNKADSREYGTLKYNDED